MIEFSEIAHGMVVVHRGAKVVGGLAQFQGVWEVGTLNALYFTASDLRAIADKLDSLNGQEG